MHQHSANCHHAAIDPQTKQTQLTIAVLLIGSFAAAELMVGVTSGSLALVAEAGHMASDSLALVLALVATRLAQSTQPSLLSDSLGSITADSPSEAQPQTAWETWAALVNGLGLIAIALWIGWEALQRLQSPPDEIASLPMLITASVGLIVNSINIALLHRGSQYDLNLRGAFLHVLADAMSCIGVIVAAIAVALLHWFWADGAISLAIAAMILFGAVPLVVRSAYSLSKEVEAREQEAE
ncbi:MAG: cation diffusion facilitator family transporter [Stenomitos rutilans HA7619-LM2]|jgi:cobalt-zinc-cadmium efflux system protein|nr:cation diffusion facilitator family transporter [Stenomitos rutilans HA7619-LM2]